jgi:hypothetical protein
MGSMYDWTDWTDCVNRAVTKYESTNLLFNEQIGLINSLGEYVWSLYTNAKRHYEEITWVVSELPDADIERMALHGVHRRPEAFDNSDVQARLLNEIWGNTEVYAVLGRIVYLIEALDQDLSGVIPDFGVYGDPVLNAQLKQVQDLQNYNFVTDLEKIYDAYKETIEKEARLCLEEKRQQTAIQLFANVLKAARKLSKELIKKDREEAEKISRKVLEQEKFEEQQATINELVTFVTGKIGEYRANHAVEKNPEKIKSKEKALDDAIQMLQSVQNQ